MEFLPSLIKQIGAYFTRRRLLINGCIFLGLSLYILYLGENNYVGWMFAGMAIIYFGFYAYYSFQKKVA